MKILLIEDEVSLAHTLRSVLERERFVVDHVTEIKLAREVLRLGFYELILLDRTLPDGDGLVLVSEIRSSHPGIPIIVLSARGDIAERIEGLDKGADDYLVKPFALDEMLARIRAVRRRPNIQENAEIRAGRLVFDLSSDEAIVDGQILQLTRRELRVLSALMKRRGRVLLRESLEQAVYRLDDYVQSNTLDSHISRLRRKLADANAGIEIHSIRGVGYFLRAEI
ncbi:response regulator transcription factor [Alishewanella sp. BS5-314]|jgi:DNA-binding response OmpR family regulator|uniref:response regulator n=1 Tax=Alishewanella sp. BS5-314 TaxID=2755587 RepID=UPI0021BAA99E|nr:response regulator transcription factor [Alishewanella sp. BS5-314]MCT8126109.1 response regulator transcription factor [Alishewanella sp. BS5-314]